MTVGRGEYKSKRKTVKIYMVRLGTATQKACVCFSKQSQSSSDGSLLLVSGFWPNSMDSNASHILLFQLTMDIFLVSVF